MVYIEFTLGHIFGGFGLHILSALQLAVRYRISKSFYYLEFILIDFPIE